MNAARDGNLSDLKILAEKWKGDTVINEEDVASIYFDAVNLSITKLR